MDFYKQKLSDPLCEAPKCNQRATHKVHDSLWRDKGVFCEEHADAYMNQLKTYYETVERLHALAMQRVKSNAKS